MDTQLSLLLVGCGNMGQAIMGGWLAKGVPPGNIRVVDPGPKAAEACACAGVALVDAITSVNADFTPDAVVLAVKPQAVADVAPLYRAYAKNALIVSIIAGTRLSWFEDQLGKECSLVRAMPNTPATIQMGISALFANDAASAADCDLAQSLFEAVGEVVWLDAEDQLDAVTAVSGSGPAYIFLTIESLTQAAIAAGLPKAIAAKLAKQTVVGAAQLADRSDLSPEELRKNVTSPGGTTAAALEVFMAKDGMEDLFVKAIAAAANRSRELG